MNIVFFGTSRFAVPILKNLAELKDSRIAAVVTQPDKPSGRKQKMSFPPVKTAVFELGLSILQPETLKEQNFLKKIKELAPDILVVAAYGKILPKELLSVSPFGALNAHASLLPKYRGASPISAAIAAGEKETGVTIMLMDEKMDHGPLLSQQKINIEETDTSDSLETKLAQSSAELLAATLPKYIAGEIKPKEQEHARATFTKILTKEDGKIDWSKSAEEIERFIRAMSPWPGAWFIFNVSQKTKRIKIIKARVASVFPPKNKKIGDLFAENQKLFALCGSGVLELNTVLPEGKQQITGEEFIRGYLRN